MVAGEREVIGQQKSIAGEPTCYPPWIRAVPLGANAGALLRLFEHGLLADHHHDAAVGYVILLAIFLEVVTDARAFGNRHVTVDDRIADVRMPADVHVVEDDRVLDLAVAVHPHVVSHHAALHASAGNDRARRY